MSLDSRVKRAARSPPRPIVLPSMIPDTDSDSATSAEMSARRRCCSLVILRRSFPTRRVSHTNSGTKISEIRRQPPVEQAHRDDRRDHGGRVLGDRRRGRRDDVVDAADVVGDPRLHLAGARAGEERQRHPLQAPVDGGAQVVHHALADRRSTCRSARRRTPRSRSRSRSSPAPARSAASALCSKIPLSSTARSRNGCSMLSPAENTISASTAHSRQR